MMYIGEGVLYVNDVPVGTVKHASLPIIEPVPALGVNTGQWFGSKLVSCTLIVEETGLYPYSAWLTKHYGCKGFTRPRGKRMSIAKPKGSLKKLLHRFA